MFYFADRRKFLKGALLGLAGASTPGIFKMPLAFAEDAQSGVVSGRGKNLIVLNLEGAMDSLSAFPYNLGAGEVSGIANILSTQRTSTLITPSYLHPAANYIGFHPGWNTLQSEVTANKLRLVQGIGISPNSPPGGSHQFCQDVYSFGDRNFTASSRGWFARLIELNGLVHNQAFGFGTRGRIDFATADPAKTPTVGQRSEELTYSDPLSPNRGAVNLQAARDLLAVADLPSTPAESKIIDALRKSYDVNELMNLINAVPLTRPFLDPIVRHPSDGNRHWISINSTMRSIARVAKYYSTGNNIDSRNRVFYAYQDGFDHHGNQAWQLSNLIEEVSLALADFLAEMKTISHPRGGTVYDHTLVIMLTEFGRNFHENGGAGTDHGWGATHFAAGGPVIGGVTGEPPDLNHATSYGQIRAAIDFPNMLKAAVDWMGYDGAEIFPAGTYLNSPFSFLAP